MSAGDIYNEEDVEVGLNELVEKGLLVRGEKDGCRPVWINADQAHQLVREGYTVFGRQQ